MDHSVVWLLCVGQVVTSSIKWLCKSSLDVKWSATSGLFTAFHFYSPFTLYFYKVLIVYCHVSLPLLLRKCTYESLCWMLTGMQQTGPWEASSFKEDVTCFVLPVFSCHSKPLVCSMHHSQLLSLRAPRRKPLHNQTVAPPGECHWNNERIPHAAHTPCCKL